MAGVATITKVKTRHEVLAAVVVTLLAIGVAWMLSGGAARIVKVQVDGRPVWVRAHRPTVAGAVEASGVRPHDGILFSALSHRRLDPHYRPVRALVGDKPATLRTPIREGSRITFHNGVDAVEPVIQRRVQVAGVGLPAVEDRIWVADQPGYDEVDVGERSGEIVARKSVAQGSPVHPEAKPVVALSFDDGPDPRWTPMVLDALRAEHVKATFCLIGFMAQRHPELVKAELADGHTLCDHSMHHILNLPSRPHSQIIDEVDQNADVIRSITGADPTFYRPPGGSLSNDVVGVAHQRGLRVLKWSIDPRDFTKPPAPVILERVITRVGPGAVILLHDGGGDRSQTVAMLKALIDQLRAKGFSFYNWQ